MEHLEKYFYANEKRMIHKFRHYFDIYERHFSKYRGQEIVLLEIGIGAGGSLQMWKDYFGPKAKIYGIDKEDCSHMDEDQIVTFKGDQADKEFLKSVYEKIGRIDILIDDGSHRSPDQIATFEALFPLIDADGVYLCEDLAMAYHIHFGGGYKSQTSIIEVAKNCIEYIQNQVVETDPPYANKFFEAVEGIHFYHGVFVMDKKFMGYRICSSIMTGEGHHAVPS